MLAPMGSLPATTEASRFGKYSLVARLATGGMAEIFLARLQGAAGFEKLICIKRILPHLARDKQFVAMFLDEARIAARISHPNVCQVFELGEIEGSYFLAMEYLEGVPLACFRRRDYYGDVPDPRLVAGIAVQACEGLHHAHQLKNTDGSVMEVVHRDISPQNLFVTVDGIVKVLDFGIAKIQDATVRTTTGAVKGTYAYMAPEQLRGERVDRRTDVFAMGIVMYETLTRRHLFKRDTDFLTFQAITGDPIEDVCVVRPDVPPALSAVIMTALSRDREERFPTARVFGEAIAAACPPLSGAAISEEIARAFPAELGEQAALIRVAREGGAFELDLDRGPSVGHGAELLTTPVSTQRAYAPHQATSVTAAASPVGLGSRSGVREVAVVPADAGPVPVLRRSFRPLLIAVLALAAGGLGAFVYAWYARVSREPVPAATSPAPASTANAVATTSPPATPPAAPPAVATVTADAGPAAPQAAVQAAPQTVSPPSTVSQNATPPNEAPAAVTQPDKHSPKPAAGPGAPRPSGSPGFITIDSAPVYAVIYIDGKSYGETPLVKVALPPGRHAVHAVAPSGATRDVRITIEAGKVAPASRIEW
jgi:eukaryotic-like serine/threonine-protein kinase